MRGDYYDMRVTERVTTYASDLLCPSSFLNARDAQALEAFEVAILCYQLRYAALAADRDDLGVKDEIAYGVCLADRFR